MASAGGSIFQKLWTSEVGVKTVHFWAPVMKWALVIAGINDFRRPVETLSVTQNFALLCTGAIWTRWCLIIKPKNYLLAAVNFFLAGVGTVQMSRIMLYQQELKRLQQAHPVLAALPEGPQIQAKIEEQKKAQ